MSTLGQWVRIMYDLAGSNPATTVIVGWCGSTSWMKAAISSMVSHTLKLVYRRSISLPMPQTRTAGWSLYLRTSVLSCSIWERTAYSSS